ncbi:glycosyltransferase [candidate division KSB3 bacterium]|uniref:Glycosyltransferase n=1 Tax=candidate division KSB3 bacterium TaxID=2044937 RepID=A0A9D5Q7M8_9BACT|nr:glycosyltransferase [candidate division KSB3 bacterium]MBD3326071.1 glycosyltransferase [candidate division KSB3 bacterium]
MKNSFETDSYPGKPKILFIGFAESTHTHAWIDLLKDAPVNVRLFGLHTTHLPPKNWPVKTYITTYPSLKLDSTTRKCLYPANRTGRFCKRQAGRFFWGSTDAFEQRWLAQIIQTWEPDIIHTLGLDPAGYFYFQARQTFKLAKIGLWIVQVRGGSDLTLSRLDPAQVPRIKKVLNECDQVLSDNKVNFTFVQELGVNKEHIASLSPIPGTGGIDVTSLLQYRCDPPSSRRMILWPKAYDSPWSLALPVFEAIKLIWAHIQPCHIHMLAMTPQTRMWYWELPEEIRAYCHCEQKIPREKVLTLMGQARIMLAPSLVDGIPNALYEAMAAGAFPIVSPLETIRTLVEDETNVLFARNLYPHEIAEAIRRAMSDDALVDKAAENNLELVQRVANRTVIGPQVVEFYKQLATQAQRIP